MCTFKCVAAQLPTPAPTTLFTGAPTPCETSSFAFVTACSTICGPGTRKRRQVIVYVLCVFVVSLFVNEYILFYVRFSSLQSVLLALALHVQQKIVDRFVMKKLLMYVKKKNSLSLIFSTYFFW